MGQAIPKQHPAVVLRSHFNFVRGLLAVAMIAVVGLTIAVVIVAGDDPQIANTGSSEVAPATVRPVAPPPDGTRYDGGPEEGTRGSVVPPVAPGTRYDGGPEEGSRGTRSAEPPVTGYDGPGVRTD
jgi:hypothetical protein